MLCVPHAGSPAIPANDVLVTAQAVITHGAHQVTCHQPFQFVLGHRMSRLTMRVAGLALVPGGPGNGT
jgi:hypothetical protein